MAVSVTVADLIPKELDSVSALLQSEAKGTPLAGVPSSLLGYATAQIMDAVRGTLQVDVFEWLTRAWCMAREIRTYRTVEVPGTTPEDTAVQRETARAKTEEATLVVLGEHHLTCTARPVVTVTVGEKSFRLDRFSIEVTAQLHAAALIIREGCIKGLQGGDGTATAVLKFGDHALHDPLPLRKIELPIKLLFREPGYRIP